MRVAYAEDLAILQEAYDGRGARELIPDRVICSGAEQSTHDSAYACDAMRCDATQLMYPVHCTVYSTGSAGGQLDTRLSVSRGSGIQADNSSDEVLIGSRVGERLDSRSIEIALQRTHCASSDSTNKNRRGAQELTVVHVLVEFEKT